MKRAVIISNGKMKNKKFYRNLIKRSDFIICVDGGSKHARSLNLIPDVIIGDLDSLNKNDYRYFLNKGSEVEKYHPIKDKTDMQMGIEYAMERGFKDILLLCVFGDRLDHVLANIFLLLKIIKKGMNVKIIDEFNEIILIQKSGKIEGKIGDTISLIPLTPLVTGITTNGLKYRLKNGRLRIDDTLGISNILTKKTAKIKIDKGKLLVIKTNS